jgi:hypothetical protein
MTPRNGMHAQNDCIDGRVCGSHLALLLVQAVSRACMPPTSGMKLAPPSAPL